MKKPHLIIDAGPGCGKSTTVIAGINIIRGQIPEWIDHATDEQKVIWQAMEGEYSSIGVQAFNASIKSELEQKVPFGVDVKTFHSSGLSMLRENGYRTKVYGDLVRYKVRDLLGYKKSDRMKREHYDLSLQVQKFVSWCKNNLLEASHVALEACAEEGRIEVNGNRNQLVELSKTIMTDAITGLSKNGNNSIDFDDMIWLPVVLDIKPNKYGLLVCDECQDLNPVQHKLITRSAHRLVCIGDPRQAIYGFRGADANSIGTLRYMLEKTERGVQTLYLQTSFRLPKSGVKNVSDYAPLLKPLDDAIDGEIETTVASEMNPQPGDLVVSRINANIVKLAFRLLRERKPIKMLGREFGNELKRIVNDNCGDAENQDELIKGISGWYKTEEMRIGKLTFSEKFMDMLNEKYSCLATLIMGCNNTVDVINTIDSLYSSELPKDQVITLSTVHRAKGLEADHVWFLEPELVPHPMARKKREREQEYNLKFVAETRHKKKLIYVHADDPE